MSRLIFAPTGLLKVTPLRRSCREALEAELASERLDRIKKQSRPAIRRAKHHHFKQTAERAA